jgi:guanylate kinase
MNKIKIIALFGEAGSGKDYLYNKVIHWDEEGALEPIFNKIVKSTTRPKRENEIDGVHYHFLPQQDFFRRQLNGSLAGVSVYRGWYYGIDAGSVVENKPNIVILDV